MSKYTVAVLQLNLNDVPDNNRVKCESWIRKAASGGAQVICLPELYSSHYFCQSEDVANFDRPEAHFFSLIDPADPAVAEVCLLTDGLTDCLRSLIVDDLLDDEAVDAAA